MSGVTFSGLATGLDTDSIVSQLMKIERLPIDRLEAQKKSEKKQLDAFSQFKTLVNDFRNAVGSMHLTSQVRSSEVMLSPDAAFSATASAAVSGTYNIAVAQLSQVQKNISAGWSSNTEPLPGTGTFTVNGTVINITEANNSLLGLGEAINKVSAATGVSATIINDGSGTNPYHMVFTGKDSSQTFTLSSNLIDDNSNPVAFSTTEAQSAQQAVVFIDGLKVVSDTNTIGNAINGLSLNLDRLSNTTHAGTPETGVKSWNWADPPVYVTDKLSLQPDRASLKEKVTTFVSSYNKIMDWVNAGYNEFAGVASAGNEDGSEEVNLSFALRGDSSINNVKRRLQGILSTAVNTSGSFIILSQLGITTQLDGTLNQDNSKLNAALEENYDSVVHLLAGEGSIDGVMKHFNSYLLEITHGSTGLYALRKDNFESVINRLDDNIRNIEPRMTKREATLRAQFTLMEQLVSNLNAQGSFLTQQMDMMSNMMPGGRR